MDNKQFVITNDEGVEIEIVDFEKEITFIGLEEDRENVFCFDISVNSKELVNITPEEKEDPYKANISVNTEYIQAHLNEHNPINTSNLSFFIEENGDECYVSKEESLIIDCSEGIGSYYVDQYLEPQNWKIKLAFDETSQKIKVNMSANDACEEQVGFKINTYFETSDVKILIRGGKNSTKESLKAFCAKYFLLDDLDIGFDEKEEIIGFKKEKKITYNLRASFK